MSKPDARDQRIASLEQDLRLRAKQIEALETQRNEALTTNVQLRATASLQIEGLQEQAKMMAARLAKAEKDLAAAAAASKAAADVAPASNGHAAEEGACVQA